MVGFGSCPSCPARDARDPGRLEPSASRGGALNDRHSIRRPALIAFAALCALAAAVATPAAPAEARAGALQQDRARARAVAAEIAALDARIGAAVNEFSRASRALEAVRLQIRETRRLQQRAVAQLELARATLAARAVAMYKHQDVTAMDAMFKAADFGDLVTQLTLVRTLARSDRDVVRTIESTRRELADRAESLAADEKTKRRLVEEYDARLATIRARLGERRAALAGIRADIRRLVAAAAEKAPAAAPSVEPPQPGDGGGDGGGPWWPLIRSAAGSNGISARGLYRLMMIESGGAAAAVGPGGYYGLFQYAPATWKGGWNPWRASPITDGAAQIKATALAIRQGYGHAWWDPSFSWAFGGG